MTTINSLYLEINEFEFELHVTLNTNKLKNGNQCEYTQVQCMTRQWKDNTMNDNRGSWYRIENDYSSH